MKKVFKIIVIMAIGLLLLGGGIVQYGSRINAVGKGSYANGATISIKPGRVSVTQYGAVGDGQHNDFEAFSAAVNSGMGEIYIPAGTYELGSGVLNVGAGISFVGESQSDCIIKNVCISSEYGISASNLTFDGGVTRTIPFTGGASVDGKVIFWLSPKGHQSVSYKNCMFTNATVASFARENAGSFDSVEVTGCTFKNFRRDAIYYSLNIDTATFKNNVFAGFGGSDLKSGFISAIWIGDITNNTYTQANNVVIEENNFSNLYTQNDFSGTVHNINANFIAIRSDKAVINNNTISNLIGYGSDREAVYTKVRDLTISGNTITNGGLGEGYICNKSQKGDAYCTITGNVLVGSAGCGIRNYAPGTISGNTITIDNCTSAITNTRRDVITNSRELIIRDNTINCGTYPTLSVNDTVVKSYSTGQAIRVAKVAAPITIENNTFNTKTVFKSYISVGNPTSSVTVRGNVINKEDKDGTGILVYSTTNGGKLADSTKLKVEGNQFNKTSADR
ncbi:MAG: glycoside hydrolase family 55 protein [Butyrivibrio sp.]|nr:glycoside hydrolase family 55 protein [Butyrivibrio sp.]